MSFSTGGMWLIHGPEQRMKTDLQTREWRKSIPYINHLLQSKYWQYYDVIMTWHTTSTLNLTTNRENGIFDWCHLFHKEESFVIGTYRPSFCGVIGFPCSKKDTLFWSYGYICRPIWESTSSFFHFQRNRWFFESWSFFFYNSYCDMQIFYNLSIYILIIMITTNKLIDHAFINQILCLLI